MIKEMTIQLSNFIRLNPCIAPDKIYVHESKKEEIEKQFDGLFFRSGPVNGSLTFHGLKIIWCKNLGVDEICFS